MTRIVVACMARNEADRFWRSALEAWSTFADEIVVLDDGSEDDTAQIAHDSISRKTHCKRVNVLRAKDDAEPAWGTEANARSLLWDSAMKRADEGDWLIIADADMTLARSPRDLLAQTEADAVAFALYDIWDKDEHGLWYREDAFWGGHLHPRLWAFRAKPEPEEGWRWSERGIHTGHAPLNYAPQVIGTAPQDYAWLHYGWSAPDIRDEKVLRYLSVYSQLSEQERRHVLSVRDPKPRLLRLPFEPELRLTRANATV